MNDISYYYISSGAKNMMYTLRYYYQEPIWRMNDYGKYIIEGVKERDHHVVNLSTDLKEAVRKATKRVGDQLRSNDGVGDLEEIYRRTEEEMAEWRKKEEERIAKAIAKAKEEDEQRWASTSKSFFEKIEEGIMPYGINKGSYLDPDAYIEWPDTYTPQGYLKSLLKKETDDLRWKPVNDALKRKINEIYPDMETYLYAEGNGEYYGEPKQRLEISAVLIDEMEFEGHYGAFFIQKFLVAQTGELLVYKGGTPVDRKIGESIVGAKATIKEHTEFRGEKQTVIQRIALPKTEKEAA